MGATIVLYTAFRDANPAEKRALVAFFSRHFPHTPLSNITESLEYALKKRPSFGGFVMSLEDESGIRAAVVANKTGMDAFHPGHQFVFVAFDKELDKGTVMTFLEKAKAYAKGGISLHLKKDHPAIAYFKDLGFSEEYVELRS
ncbi:MAG: hypothetical protein NWS63_06730 [Saprospiraceae bacterium]|jgi:hypothetical protein|nr:hypothetical protein [Saprospiraceae bacterium]MDP4997886.1 hypothetical protein [Saprospiraceae bacterium]